MLIRFEEPKDLETDIDEQNKLRQEWEKQDDRAVLVQEIVNLNIALNKLKRILYFQQTGDTFNPRA